MIIVEDRSTGCRLVSVASHGWYFYRPPIFNPAGERFISCDDALVEIILEKTGLSHEEIFTRRFGEVLIEHLVARPAVKKERRAFAHAL